MDGSTFTDPTTGWGRSVRTLVSLRSPPHEYRRRPRERPAGRTPRPGAGWSGPAPMAAMMLSELGADVVRIDRPAAPALPDVLDRGRRSVVVDLKHADGPQAVFRLAEKADILLEPRVDERGRSGAPVLRPARGAARAAPVGERPGRPRTLAAAAGRLRSPVRQSYAGRVGRRSSTGRTPVSRPCSPGPRPCATRTWPLAGPTRSWTEPRSRRGAAFQRHTDAGRRSGRAARRPQSRGAPGLGSRRGGRAARRWRGGPALTRTPAASACRAVDRRSRWR